jgi:hypothetical protein
MRGQRVVFTLPGIENSAVIHQLSWAISQSNEAGPGPTVQPKILFTARYFPGEWELGLDALKKFLFG